MGSQSEPKVRINKAVVDFNTWYTWKNKLTCDVERIGYIPHLLDNDGFRCCLGFICQSLGVKDEDLLNVDRPDNIEEFIDRFNIISTVPSDLLATGRQDSLTNKQIISEAVDINDESTITIRMSEKIEKLIELFNCFNFELHFRNLPTYIYDDISDKFLNRVSTSKGTYIFASTTPVWKI